MTTLDDSPMPRLPSRDATGHKGSFGCVAVIGGCAADPVRMIGAPALAALAAFRAGAGVVRLVMPAPILSAGLALCPSATGVALPVDYYGQVTPHQAAEILDDLVTHCDAIVIGPGLGPSDATRAMTLRLLSQQGVPLIVDADAMNALAGQPDLARDLKARALLTPHPGEYRRLAAGLGITLDPTSATDRPEAAAALAQRLGCVVVLKGAGTIVSDALRKWRCGRGHPCLGTAGTGDVLAGLMAGILAQTSAGPAPALSLYAIARIAVEAHAIAGERWAQKRGVSAGMLALELTEMLPAVLEEMRSEAPRTTPRG